MRSNPAYDGVPPRETIPEFWVEGHPATLNVDEVVSMAKTDLNNGLTETEWRARRVIPFPKKKPTFFDTIFRMFGCTQHKDASLEDYLGKHATVTVIRGGRKQTVDADELVVGDVVVFSRGQAVPADCRILRIPAEGEKDAVFSVDESPLTGEPLPMKKTTDEVLEEGIIYQNMVYLGTTLSDSGTALGVVTSVGSDTMMGTITAAGY
jgi:hypothetical protein